MTSSKDSSWGDQFHLSNAELERLRRAWAAKGREVWNEATRLGRQVQARTTQELEALGRAELAKAEASRAAASAISDAVGRTGAAVNQGLEAMGRTQMAFEKDRQRAQDAVSRTAAAPAKLIPRLARMGTTNDPGPGRLGLEWASGRGPQHRTLDAESSFSREFAEAPSVQRYVQGRIEDWSQRPGGVSGTYANPPERRAKFGVTEFLDDLDAGNGASHFVGSWDVTGQRRNDHIDWRTTNMSDTNSLFGGRILRESGLPSFPAYPRPHPGGRTTQEIRFRTDLTGRPTGTPR